MVSMPSTSSMLSMLSILPLPATLWYPPRMLWGLTCILLLIAAFLLTLALRGRRIGSSPHCRKCRFDLSGLALHQRENQTAEAARCPECGRSLDTPRAIAIGSRRPRPRTLVGATVVLLIGIAAGALAISSSNTSWNQRKPAWLLVVEARLLAPHTDPAEAIAGELRRRRRLAALPEWAFKAVVDSALDAHASSAVVWDDSDWQSLLSDAFESDLVTPEQADRYLAVALGSPKVDLRELKSDGTSTGRAALELMPNVRVVLTAPIAYTASVEAAWLDDQPLQLEPVPFQSGYLATINYVGPPIPGFLLAERLRWSVMTPEPQARPVLPRLTPGTHNLRIRWRLDGYICAQEFTPGTNVVLNARAHVTSSVETQDLLDIVADPLNGIRLVNSSSPSAAAPDIQLRRTNGIPDTVFVTGPFDAARPERKTLHCSLWRADQAGSELWVAGRVELRTQDRTWPLLRYPNNLAWGNQDDVDPPELVIFPPAPDDPRVPQEFGIALVDDLPNIDTADLVIVPDPRLLADRGIAGEFWNEEIVLSDVRIHWGYPPEPDEGEN